jgi:hypothetical protein
MGAFEDIDPRARTHGRAPIDANNQARGPYGYFWDNPNGLHDWGGLSFGAGLMNGNVGREGQQANVSVLNGDFGMGEFASANGKTNYGIDAQANLVNFGIAPGNGLGPFGFDVGVLNADAGAYGNDTDASVGAYASLIGGGVTLGNKEHSARVGVAAGVGLSGRLHYGDADHDGARELGFGVDVGPFQFDMQSEYLGRAYNWVKGLF